MTTMPQPAVLRSVDVPINERIADLRREVEGIQELNKLYREQKYHSNRDQIAYQQRMVKLKAIIAELGALRRTKTDRGQ